MDQYSQPATGAVVFALHGSASTGKQWRALSEQLGGHANVVAPDLPGYGCRAHDRASRFVSISDLATSFCQPIHLVAHSFGCAIALRIAHEFPEHVASMTLFDPVVPLGSSKGEAVFPKELQELWSHGREATEAGLMKAFMDFWGGARSWQKLHPKQRERLIDMAPGLRRDFTEAERGFWSPQRPGFRGPLSILCGGSSPRVTIDMAESIARSCPQAHLIWLAGHGHLAPLTEPCIIAKYFAHCLRAQGLMEHHLAMSTTRHAA